MPIVHFRWSFRHQVKQIETKHKSHYLYRAKYFARLLENIFLNAKHLYRVLSFCDSFLENILLFQCSFDCQIWVLFCHENKVDTTNRCEALKELCHCIMFLISKKCCYQTFQYQISKIFQIF